MTCDRSTPRLQSYRSYRLLVVLELLLTVIGLALSIAAALGLL